jgi:hypothetical protein
MKVLHVAGENAATGRTGENGGYGDMTLLAHSVATLLPFGCGGRYLHTDKSKGIRHDKRAERTRRCRFSIGSAP